MSLLELIEKLEILLADVIGTLGNGQPAIVPDYGDLSLEKINGLACYIQPSPEPGKNISVSGNLKFISEYWIVTLVQYDRKKTTLKAARLIQKTFQIFSDDLTTVTESSPEQRTFRLRVDGFI